VKRPTAAYDDVGARSGAPVRLLIVAAGLHANIVQRISLQEARELVAELDAAIACAIENVETKPRDIPKPKHD
jgi:hypothetical protein